MSHYKQLYTSLTIRLELGEILSFCITFAAFLGRLVLGEERNSFCLSVILEWSVKARGLPFLLKTYVYQRIFQEDI